ncbi:hypothetical protein LTR94_027388, partial [Friedmanniomyces endolithicus]
MAKSARFPGAIAPSSASTFMNQAPPRVNSLNASARVSRLSSASACEPDTDLPVTIQLMPTQGLKVAARKASVGVTAYAMSKSALLSLTRGLARELGPQGVTVNLVAPGSTDTEANPADGESAEFQRGLTALGRFAEPVEIANAVAFLASPAAGVITGSVLTADGGATA